MFLFMTTKNNSVTPYVLFMTTNKKQVLPLMFFFMTTNKNSRVTPYVFFMTTNKKQQCYPLCWLQHGLTGIREMTTVGRLT